MASVKRINNGENREPRPRRTKKEVKSLLDIDNSDDEEDIVKNAVADIVDSNKLDKSSNIVNIQVTHNAQHQELNFSKQYQNRFNACNRDLFKVDKVNGSANKEKQKIVKLEFQTGMFELLKKKMVEVMKEHYSIVLAKDPKVEMYGQSKSEERYLLDIKFPDSENKSEHNVKVTIYNTNCCMSVNSKTDIKNQTVAEYFVSNIIKDVVNILEKRYDIPALNEHFRQLAVLGLEKVKKGFHDCYQCKKTLNTESSLKCQFCKKQIHESCIRISIGDENTKKPFNKWDAFNCQVCVQLETPKAIEDTTSVKIDNIYAAIEKLFGIQGNVLKPIEGENSQNNEVVLELEELFEAPSSLPEDEHVKETEKEPVIDLTTTGNEEPNKTKPCCVWAQCSACERLKKEKKEVDDEVTLVKVGLKKAEDMANTMKNNINNLENQLRVKADELDSVKHEMKLYLTIRKNYLKQR